MNRDKRLQELVSEPIATGAVGDAAMAAFGVGGLQVAFGATVDWNDPRAPIASFDSTFELATAEVWAALADASPTWINLAWYPRSPAGGCLIIEHNTTEWSSVWADPAIAISSAPRGVKLTLVGPGDNGIERSCGV